MVTNLALVLSKSIENYSRHNATQIEIAGVLALLTHPITTSEYLTFALCTTHLHYLHGEVDIQ